MYFTGGGGGGEVDACRVPKVRLFKDDLVVKVIYIPFWSWFISLSNDIPFNNF